MEGVDQRFYDVLAQKNFFLCVVSYPDCTSIIIYAKIISLA